MTLRNTDTVQQTRCRLPDKSKCCTRQPLRRKKQPQLQKQAGCPREQGVALLGRPLSGAPLPCLCHQPRRVCILCTLHSGTDTGELGEAEGPKRQMERGPHRRLDRLHESVVADAAEGVAATAASDDGSQGWRREHSLQLPPGGLGSSHTRASPPFLPRRWAGTAAVLSWSWVRRGLQVSGLLQRGFPSAERGALSTAAILPCLLHDWVWPCLSLSTPWAFHYTDCSSKSWVVRGWDGEGS